MVKKKTAVISLSKCFPFYWKSWKTRSYSFYFAIGANVNAIYIYIYIYILVVLLSNSLLFKLTQLRLPLLKNPEMWKRSIWSNIVIFRICVFRSAWIRFVDMFSMHLLTHCITLNTILRKHLTLLMNCWMPYCWFKQSNSSFPPNHLFKPPRLLHKSNNANRC